ncbi:hypothetical protein [Herbiconiux sp. A18JL235]|uniref:AAA+ ATPase domain-containing protein n=1 Tax=Herbiconiux sp. A18JL235 TaxID=3152363 RepID=A0AB39BJT0_9MICO
MDGAIAISALGAVVGLQFEKSISEDDANRLSELWASTLTHEPAETSISAALAPASADVTAQDFSSLAAALSTRVTLTAIEQRKSDLVMIHACGVALPDGRVVAFVGPSGRGKTTLARALGRHYGYVTDETVGIDSNGIVYPYRKPLSIIEDRAAPQVKTQIAPGELDLLPIPSTALRIAAIVLLDRSETYTGPPEVSDVSMRDALVSLVPELSYLPELPRPLQRVAGLIDSVGGVRRLRYREANDVPVVVPDLIKPSRESSWNLIADDGPHHRLGAGEFVRETVLDQLELEGEYVALRGRSVLVLNGIGPAIWDALVSPRTPTQITEFVVDRHGEPEDTDSALLVTSALSQMVDSGLVRSETALH